jgi:hypothetical protein
MPPKGTSNNPAGRPAGVGPVAKLRRELLSDEKIGPLVAKVYEMAMAGDLVAARLILDRVLPALKAQAANIQVAIPTGTLTEKALALLEAAAGGSLPPDVAAEMITALSRIVTIEQATELKARLDALEMGDYA